MRSIKIFFSLILIMGIILLVSGKGISQPVDYYVDDDGTYNQAAGTCDGTDTCYTVIQFAISAATPAHGDRVIVCPGAYTENIFMKNGVTVVSEGPDTPATYNDPWSTYSTTVLERATLTIISGGGGLDPVVTFDGTSVPFSASTKLDGFTVENINPADPGYPLVAITGGGTYPQVKNCIIRNNKGSGTSGGVGNRGRWGVDEYDTAPTIDNNFIHRVKGPGIGNGPYSHATITNNEIWDCLGVDGPGIGLQGDAYPTIEDNLIFENNRAGIGSGDPEYGLEAKGGTLTIPAMQRNDIHDNRAAGIALVRASGDTGTINVTIGASGLGNDNEIYQNSYTGIELDGITNTTIENNKIHNNGTGKAGLHINGSYTQVTIKDSNIHHNGMAGIRKDTAGSLTVTGSEIDSNGTAGIFISASGSNTIIGNDIDSNGAAGITINHGSGTIAQNNIYNNMVGIVFGTIGSASLDYDIIKNNIYQNNTTAGISVPPGSSVTPTLDIRQNRVYGQQNTSTGGGIQVVRASGAITIENNLVYENGRGGTRFGDSTTVVKNNTVVGNGSTDFGGGIIHSDNDPPNVPTGDPPGTLVVKNNISTHNNKAGFRACGCDRDYNLVYLNNGTTDDCGWYTDSGVSYVTVLSCANKQFGGCGASFPVPLAMDGPHDIIADPEFVNKSADDYHLDGGVPSPAINAGDDTKDMGCFGGLYPMHNLIDVDTSTGNTPAGGTDIVFDLGSSYTVTHVRLYSTSAHTWDVYVGSCSDPDTCTCTWGTAVLTGWSVGGAGQWYEGDLTDKPGQYIKLVSDSALGQDAIFEFSYKESGNTYWRTPSIPVAACNDING